MKKLKYTIIGVISSIYNLTFNRKKIKQIANERQKSCDNCEMNSKVFQEKFKVKLKRKDKYCLGCKCNLFLKQNSTKTKCPLNLWNTIK